jgi:SAM-dependent methyltransferase
MFPLLYHAHHQTYQEDLDFWLNLVQECAGPVLELGCGTGRVLTPLTQAGVVTYGLDLDLAMLKFLRQQIPDSLREQQHVFQADMTAFHLGIQFPLIVMPCNTFSTLDGQARLACLRKVQQHLRAGGRFAASLPNPVSLAQMSRQGESEVETSFTHPESGNPVQVSSAWKRFQGIFELTWHYDHLLPDGVVQRLSVVTHQHIASPEMYCQEFQAAGLSVQASYGDFDCSSYTIDSPALILLAVRQ